MKEIKLSGREAAVLRAIDFANGNTGTEIEDRTQIHAEDLLDILQGLMDVGYVETMPASEHTSLESYQATTFEVNPSYALELKTAIARR